MSRALVLGGGGPVGIGWEAGLLLGLAGSGVVLAGADAVVGTSAGSVVGAHLALGLDLGAEVARRGGAPEGLAPAVDDMGGRLQRLMALMAEGGGEGASPEEGRARLGRFALEADTIPEERFLAAFSSLQGQAWPSGFACTAVDAETGRFVVWDADAGVDLHAAVASSCAVPGVYPPVTLHGRRYVDGGMRSALNADVADGHDVVVVVSVMPLALPEGLSDPRFERVRQQQEAELGVLREGGAEVAVVGPNQAFLEISGFGLHLMDASRVAAAAEAGVRQGAEEAARLGRLWGRA